MLKKNKIWLILVYYLAYVYSCKNKEKWYQNLKNIWTRGRLFSDSRESDCIIAFFNIWKISVYWFGTRRSSVWLWLCLVISTYVQTISSNGGDTCDISRRNCFETTHPIRSLSENLAQGKYMSENTSSFELFITILINKLFYTCILPRIIYYPSLNNCGEVSIYWDSERVKDKKIVLVRNVSV